MHTETMPDHQTVLVTGGNGFLGKAIAQRLLGDGFRVRSLSRRRSPDLASMGIAQFTGDIRDASVVDRACRGAAMVFHTAAKAGVWGDSGAFYGINVTGTGHVISACRRHGSLLVHTSSPSVVFDGKDMAGADETAPYPKRYTAAYPATKAQAEQLVRQASREGLPAVILRPHLIWGPGDNHLVPQILQQAPKLRRVGDGRNLVDTVYIDNAADAHVLAARGLARDRTLSGNIYFISQGEPVPLWWMVDAILAAAGKPPVRGQIPVSAAVTAGRVLEWMHKAFRLQGAPRMTRFMAHELSTSHWFDISAARNDLGYVPRVSTREGLRRLAAWLAHGPPETPHPAPPPPSPPTPEDLR